MDSIREKLELDKDTVNGTDKKYREEAGVRTLNVPHEIIMFGSLND